MAFGNIFADADVGAGEFQTTASAGAGAELGFGPTSTGSSGHPLMPSSSNGFAWGFWLGVAGVVTLCAIRHSLPA